MANDELSTKDWTSMYSVAMGISGHSELEKLATLRAYQHKIRKITPERDEMVMMNTWGDRNQDASINEAFVKKEIDACAKLNITHLQITMDGNKADPTIQLTRVVPFGINGPKQTAARFT